MYPVCVLCCFLRSVINPGRLEDEKKTSSRFMKIKLFFTPDKQEDSMLVTDNLKKRGVEILKESIAVLFHQFLNN